MSGGVFRFKRHLAGTREDFEPCAIVPDEIKLLMMKIVAESKTTKEKKMRLNSIDEDEESAEGAEEATNLHGQKGFGSKGKEGSASSGSGNVQATLNQLMKKKEKPLIDAQVAEFFLHKCHSIQCYKKSCIFKDV